MTAWRAGLGVRPGRSSGEGRPPHEAERRVSQPHPGNEAALRHSLWRVVHKAEALLGQLEARVIRGVCRVEVLLRDGDG